MDANWDYNIYPRTGDRQTVYPKGVVTDPNIQVGDYTMYNDFVHDPVDFQKNNVCYHYPINHDQLIIGKFCSIACGAKFLFNSANHAMGALSTYPFPLFFEAWGLDKANVTRAWDNKGDIVVGNDVWIGYEAVILAGVTIGDGAIIGARAVVTKDVPPYTIVGGVPAKPIRKRFPDETIKALQTMRWWDWPKARIAQNLDAIRTGDIDRLRTVEVVAALIRDRDRFMICQRPANKARGLLWEFVGGKVEPGETKAQALIRECREELAVTLTVGDVYMDVTHVYPDITVHLTLFRAAIAEGTPQKLEHNDIRWITVAEIPNYDFCPADEQILRALTDQGL